MPRKIYTTEQIILKLREAEGLTVLWDISLQPLKLVLPIDGNKSLLLFDSAPLHLTTTATQISVP